MPLCDPVNSVDKRMKRQKQLMLVGIDAKGIAMGTHNIHVYGELTNITLYHSDSHDLSGIENFMIRGIS